MNRARRKGFALLLVLAFLGLAGAMMIVVSDVANSMLYETDRGLARARQRNLDASALAWLRRNRDVSPERLAQGVDLDANSLGGQRLEVRRAGEGQVEIATETRAGRIDLRASATFSRPGETRAQ